MKHGTQVLISEVIRHAQQEAGRILREAEQEAKRITEEAAQKVKQFRDSEDEKTKEAIKLIKKKELTATELEAKKQVLLAKKQLIEDVFSRAQQAFEELPDKKRGEIILLLFQKASSEMDVGVLYCNSKDAGYLKKSPVKIQDMLGGLIAESNDGLIRADYRFEVMFESVREAHLKEVVERLFS